MQHSHIYAGTSLTQAQMSTYPNLEIKGHDDSWAINQSSPFYIFSLGGGGEGGWTGGSGTMFNFNYSGGNWTCPQATSSFGINNKMIFINDGRIASAQTKLRDTYQNANTGTATSNTCTITNEVNFNFYDGRVRFIMAPGNYNVTGGTKLSQYNSADGTKTIVLARVNIPASGTTSVSITSAGGGTTLLWDGFNTYTTGSAPTGWTTNISGGTVTVAGVPSATEKSLKLYKSAANANYAAASKKFTSQTSGIVTYDAWVMTPETTSIKYIMMRNNAESKIACKLSFDTGNIKVNDSTTVQPFAANQWYHVVADLNIATKTFTLTIDGVSKGTYNFSDTSVTDLGAVLFSISPNFMGTFYVNNIDISK